MSSLPYDVLTEEEYRAIAEKNEKSFVHVIRPEVDCPLEMDIHDEAVYQKGRENLNAFIEKGYLVQDGEPAYYVYRQIMGEQSQIGFLTGVYVGDYDKGLVKKHENTREDKEKDRIKHIEVLNAHAGPSFLVYRSKAELDKILLEYNETAPEVSITAEDGIVHDLWVVRDSALIEKITALFKEVDALYIADGHHRTKASAVVGLKRKADGETAESQYIMSVIFPDNMLKILPYNRAVKDLNGLNVDELKAKIGENFTIEEVEANEADGGYQPANIKEIGMYLEGKWYLLKAKDAITNNDPVKSLDVSLLQDYVLAPLLSIDDPRLSDRISFIGGIRGTGYLKKIVDSGKYGVAFSMYATSMNQLLDVADADMLMPPKSTWFEPKLRSGMVVHLLD